MEKITEIRKPVEKEYKAFQLRFANALNTEQPVLKDICQHILDHHGKQVRPLLTLLSAKLCGTPNDKTYDIAAVLELLHTASLLHDDVVDETLQRRGEKSVNSEWGNKLAILGGDYILSMAMRMLVLTRNVRLQQTVCELVQQLSIGEVMELHHDTSMWIDEDQYYEIIKRKTASLFAACTETGAISVGATGYQTTHLRRFGEQLGLCFQIQDDILDYSDSEQLGKPTMNDIRDHKVTLPLIIALRRATERERKELIERIGNHDIDWELESDIKSLVLRYDGVGYCRQQLDKHRKEAQVALTVFHPITRVHESLLSLLHFTIARNY